MEDIFMLGFSILELITGIALVVQGIQAPELNVFVSLGGGMLIAQGMIDIRKWMKYR